MQLPLKNVDLWTDKYITDNKKNKIKQIWLYVFMMGNKRVYVIHPQLLNHVFIFLMLPRRSLQIFT
jgi:hypothetical protein